MKNVLELFDTVEGWIAEFSGTTGMGEAAKEEKAHNLAGDDKESLIAEALLIWGADRDETEIVFY